MPLFSNTSTASLQPYSQPRISAVLRGVKREKRLWARESHKLELPNPLAVQFTWCLFNYCWIMKCCVGSTRLIYPVFCHHIWLFSLSKGLLLICVIIDAETQKYRQNCIELLRWQNLYHAEKSWEIMTLMKHVTHMDTSFVNRSLKNIFSQKTSACNNIISDFQGLP